MGTAIRRRAIYGDEGAPGVHPWVQCRNVALGLPLPGDVVELTGGLRRMLRQDQAPGGHAPLAAAG